MRRVERRLLPTGNERIDHPNRSGHHDDLANACAGALWRCSVERRIVITPEFLQRALAMRPSREVIGANPGRDTMFMSLMRARGRVFG